MRKSVNILLVFLLLCACLPTVAEKASATPSPTQSTSVNCISIYPKEVIAKHGDQVTLTVTQKGNTYVWQKRVSEEEPWETIGTTAKDQLTLDVSEEMNGWQIRCCVVIFNAATRSNRQMQSDYAIVIVTDEIQEVKGMSDTAISASETVATVTEISLSSGKASGMLSTNCVPAV